MNTSPTVSFQIPWPVLAAAMTESMRPEAYPGVALSARATDAPIQLR